MAEPKDDPDTAHFVHKVINLEYRLVGFIGRELSFPEIGNRVEQDELYNIILFVLHIIFN